VPLLGQATVERLLAHHRARRAAATVLTFTPPDPAGYGRIVRKGRRGPSSGSSEERDATGRAAPRRVQLRHLLLRPRALWPALDRLSPDNDQAELYLPDVIGRLSRGRRRVESVHVDDPLEVAGVNDRRQLAQLEAVVRDRTLARLMTEGVTVLDPGATYVEADVVVGRDRSSTPVSGSRAAR
jgi:bifunctional UDP-N-acetylglucosamine pyrophosphorylase/glucosamine-1-phosphate N-acetyltransferase